VRFTIKFSQKSADWGLPPTIKIPCLVSHVLSRQQLYALTIDAISITVMGSAKLMAGGYPMGGVGRNCPRRAALTYLLRDLGFEAPNA